MSILHKAYLLFFLFGLLSLNSCKQDPCASKEGFLEHFSAFITDFETAKADLDDTKRQAMEDRYQGIVNDCYKKYKEELTLKEKQDFWKKSLAFYVDRYDGNFSTILGEKRNDPFYQYVKDELVQLTKESGATFLFSLQSIFKDELPKLMEVFSSEIEKIAKDLLGDSTVQ